MALAPKSVTVGVVEMGNDEDRKTLLKYSRVDAMEGSKESIDTAQLLAEIIASLSPPERIVIDLAPDMPTLRTDRLQLGQVFANLIGNSIKHHGANNVTSGLRCAMMGGIMNSPWQMMVQGSPLNTTKKCS